MSAWDGWKRESRTTPGPVNFPPRGENPPILNRAAEAQAVSSGPAATDGMDFTVTVIWSLPEQPPFTTV